MCHNDIKWADTVGKNIIDRLAQCRVALNIQFVKSTKYVKYNKGKHNKLSMSVM